MSFKKFAKLADIRVPQNKSASMSCESSDSPSPTAGGRRTSRACDQCRRTKTKCDHDGDSNVPCRSCLLAGYDCTFFEPTQKRGPPKGYLSALENRLHEAEALLGVIISASDIRAKTLVADLRSDALAGAIIRRITNSVFGPVGRAALRGGHSPGGSPITREPTDSRRQQMNCREVALMGGDTSTAAFTTPSNAWQDYLCSLLSTRSPNICEPSHPLARTPSSPCLSNSNDFACYLTPRGSTEFLCEEKVFCHEPMVHPKPDPMAEETIFPSEHNWCLRDPKIAAEHFSEGLPANLINVGLSAPCGWGIQSSPSDGSVGFLSQTQNKSMNMLASDVSWAASISSASISHPIE